MRDKFKEVGFKGWSDYEILEYMLYSTYRQKDTNPIAHRLLMSSNNSIVKLLKNAEDMDLANIVSGVGETTALYLRSLKSFIDYYCDKKITDEPLEIGENNVEAFIKSLNFPDDREEMMVICLDAFMRVKCVSKVTEASGSYFAETKLDKLIKAAAQSNADNMILVHNHPSGNDEVSLEDINMTIQAEKLFDAFGLFLIDHYILCGKKVVSIKMARIESKYGKKFKGGI